jgi:hypothetical protein
MFCQDWHLALGTWLGLVEVCSGLVVELVWNVEVFLSFGSEE